GLLDHDGVHDRKDARASVVVRLYRAIVREQAAHARGAAEKRLGHPRGEESVDRAGVEEGRERLVLGDALQAHVGRQAQGDLLAAARMLLAAGQPVQVGRAHPVIVLQDAAQPDRRRHLVLGDADALALQVLRALDAGRHVDVRGRVPKGARGEDRNGDEGEVAARPAGHVAAERHLGHVELLVDEHAPEDLLRPLEGDDGEVDALGPYGAVAERRDTVVVAARQVERELSHPLTFSPDSDSAAWPPAATSASRARSRSWGCRRWSRLTSGSGSQPGTCQSSSGNRGTASQRSKRRKSRISMPVTRPVGSSFASSSRKTTTSSSNSSGTSSDVDPNLDIGSLSTCKRSFVGPAHTTEALTVSTTLCPSCDASARHAGPIDESCVLGYRVRE